jgi:hypothetical protein
MNIVRLIINLTLLLVNILPVYGSLNLNLINTNHRLRNTGLRFLIFSKKNTPNILEDVKDFYTIYYNKAIVTISERLIEYNSLSEEDRTLIENIISLCY